MEKRYIAIYLYGFLFSVLLFVVLYFVDFHYLAFSPRENDFLEGEYWEKVFLDESFIVQPQYSLNNFLRLFLKSRNYPKDGWYFLKTYHDNLEVFVD